MNVTQLRPPRITLVDQNGIPCEAEIPSKSKPHITYKMRRTGGRWLHMGQPCEAAQFGAECFHKQALEALTKEETMTTEVIEAESREIAVRPAQPMTLFGTTEPAAILGKAEAVANVLMKKVRAHTDLNGKQDLVANIRGKEHICVGGWTLLGSLVGVYPVCIWTHPIADGWEARVEARTLDGALVGAAEAECLKTETSGPWAKADDYALRSMAQTRATSKALRMPLGFIASLAGFEGTPAEEMTFAQEPQGSGLRTPAPPRDRSARMPPPPAAYPHPPQGTVAPECPAGHGVAAFVKAGVSKAGREYGAFWGCRDKSCVAGYKGKAWSINAEQWDDELSQKAQLASAPGEREDPDALPFED